ncbi:hypothetical protein YTPLAS18_36370 [Nitrospira sp.]|nr:hypothetical protein YTPLAS18_36370 [Nitrospira sp.]
MSWETPSYHEVNMSSEIGAYQDEFEERAPTPLEASKSQTLPIDDGVVTQA